MISVPAVTALYAALAGLVLFALSVRVIARRRRLRVPLGDGGDAELAARVRAHGNFAEYAPLVLLLLLLAELAGWPPVLLHVIGATLIAGRLAHAWSLAAGNLRARVLGMALTFAALLAGTALNGAAALGVRP